MSRGILVNLLQNRHISLLDSHYLQILASLPLSEYTQLIRMLLAGSDDRPLVLADVETTTLRIPLETHSEPKS
jgi:hypothetical protein